MAIIIPSKNIYNKDNDKVRDNVVDRIEVSAVAVLPSNEYETPVYNLSNNDDFERRANVADFKSSSSSTGQGTYTHTLGASYLSLQPQFANFKLIIPKVKNNKLIEKILYQDNKIGVSIFLKKYTGTGTGFAQRTNYINPTSISNLQYQISEITGTTSMDDPILTYENNVGVSPSIVTLLNKINSDVISDTLNSPIYKEDENNFYLEFNVFVGYEQYNLLGANSFPSANASFASADVYLSGEWVKYVPQKVEITIYGNTIGIDLNDTPIYVPDVRGSNPLSVDGNELMQTQNYIEREIPIRIGEYIESGLVVTERKAYSEGNLLIVGESVTYNAETAKVVDYNNIEGYYILRSTAGGGISNAVEGAIINVYTKTNQIKANFMDTLKEYSRGKETATIRCSISDYYDENGDKKLSISPYKNILSDIIIKSQTLNGVEIIVNDSGLIELTGVATKNIVLKLNNTTPITQGAYYFSGCPTGGSLISYSLRVRTVRNGALLQDYDDIGNGIAININKSDVEYFVWLMIEAGTNVNGLIFKPMLTNGSKDKEFLPIGQNSGNMFFKLYDEVIPMVYGANGVDKPLSKYKDGVTKTFKVLGTKIFYDGAVWQELSLQETFIGGFNSSGGGSSGGGGGSTPEPELPYIISADGVVSAREAGAVFGDLYLPYETTAVAEDGFANCKGLISVTFVNGEWLPEIGDSAFSGCETLGQITFVCTLDEFISAYLDDIRRENSWFADLQESVVIWFGKGAGYGMTKAELIERYGN